jgi:hypothetical protein
MVKDWLRHLARIYMPVYQFRSDNLKIIYAGYSPIKRSYYARLLLNQKTQSTFLGWHWYSKMPGLLNSRNIDMAVIELSRITMPHFQEVDGYVIPVWTPIRVNIDKPENEVFSNQKSSFNDILKRIRKYKLTYEMLSDSKSFDYFNEKFYKPYMNSRHKDEAFIEDLDVMWEKSEEPLLIAVKENEIIVGMAFIRRKGDILDFVRLGLLDGNLEYLHHGVIGAFYYYGLHEGYKMGCKYVDLGGTRPFLNDGLTRYKMRVGGEFLTDLSPSKEYLWFGVNRKSKNSSDFLSANPFMYVNKDFVLTKYSEEPE